MWTDEEEELYKTWDSVGSRSWKQGGRWGRMSTIIKSTMPILNDNPWTRAEIKRWWWREKEEGQIVRVSYLRTETEVGPCVASGNGTTTGLDRESENNHLLSQYDHRRASCRSRLRGRTMFTA